MSDEETASEETASEETAAEEGGSEEHTEAKAPDNTETDGNVVADFVVSVVPEETVSIHYTVRPADATDAVTSVSTSFALKKNHMVVHTYAGSTTTELIEPKDGQGATGNTGVDTSVFSEDPDGELYAILAGTVRKGDETLNFFFEKPFEVD